MSTLDLLYPTFDKFLINKPELPPPSLMLQLLPTKNTNFPTSVRNRWELMNSTPLQVKEVKLMCIFVLGSTFTLICKEGTGGVSDGHFPLYQIFARKTSHCVKINFERFGFKHTLKTDNGFYFLFSINK